MHSHLFAKKRVAAAVSVALGVAGAAPVVAQQSASGDEPVIEEVIVTGIRSSLMRAMDTKRESRGIVDAITAEDIGDFPDTNLAESLQRITGVSISRERGEGKNVTVRGFGPDYNLVTLNGRQMPTHAGTGRSFDFADLASESVASVEVYKTSRSNISSGGVGATINIKTTKPLDQPGLKAGGSVKGVHDQSTYDGNDYTPELSGFYSQTFMDDTIGIALSGSFQERHHGEVSYQINDWLEGTAGASNEIAIKGDNHVNRPEAGDIVSVPQNIIYQLDEHERTRVNGQMTLQWKPIESLTATLDYTTVELELDTRWNNMSAWFAQEGQAGTRWTEGPIVSPILFEQAAGGNLDIPMGGGIQASKNERESVGLNLVWDVMGNLRLNLDYHDSSAERSPNSRYGSRSLVSIASYNRQHITVDYSSGIPVATIIANDPLTPDDMQIGGSQFENIWAEMDIQQTHLSGTFDLTDTISFDFGVQTTDLENFESSTLVERGTWGQNQASALGSIADLVRPASLKGIFDEISGGDRINNNFFIFDMEAVARRAEELQRLPATDPMHLNPVKTGAEGGDCETGFCANSNSNEPGRSNRHEEETLSVYFQASYEGELLERLFNVRAGIRYEETDVTASGQAQNYASVTWDSDNDLTLVPTPGNAVSSGLEDSYDHILPNIDFDIEVWDDLIFRAAYSKTITRPNFDQLDGNLSLTTRLRVENGEAMAHTATVGDPGLKPYESENFDLSLEWYYSEASYVSVGYFDKTAENFITDVTRMGQVVFDHLYHPGRGTLFEEAKAAVMAAGGDPTDNRQVRNWIFQNRADAPGVDASNESITGQPGDAPALFNINTNINSDREASVDGWELAWQHNFWDTGFGFIVNMTLADGSATFNDRSMESQFALPGLSDTRNLIAFYDKDGLQARLAYNWRDSYYTGGDVRPTYKEEYEQWDISISYDLGDIVSTWEGFGGMGGLVVFMEGVNITDETTRDYGRNSYQARGAWQTGPRYNFGFRYTY